MLDEEYRIKLDALYNLLNSGEHKFTATQQDFLDEFYDNDGDLAISISDIQQWKKDKIIYLWDIYINEDRENREEGELF